MPRTTVRDWRTSADAAARGPLCPRCWERSRPIRFEPDDHAETLGLYDVSNRSSDILDLVVATGDSVGVQCRRYDRHIRICRRAGVAAPVEHAGLKA